MDPSDALAVAMSFVSRINDHDVAGLVALMMLDHTFVDGLGNVFSGREKMRQGWTAYFQWFPDYGIEVTEGFSRGNEVALFGKARGTFAVNGNLPKENFWEIPAAWKVVVKDGLIAEWRVYGDNDPARKIMAANTQPKPTR
jgi:hypothetical protein